MASLSDRDDRTEAPTPKRLTTARCDGDVLQSKDLGTALMMAAAAGWVWMVGPSFVATCKDLLRHGLSFASKDVRHFDPLHAAETSLLQAALPLLSLLGLSLIIAIAGPAALGALGFRSRAFAFKASRIDPLAGVQRIFGPQGFVELIKSVIKAAMLGAIGYWAIMAALPRIWGLSAAPISQASSAAGGFVVTLLFWLSLGLVLIAFIDVPIQMFRRQARLRMTKQEVKAEARESDGAPELKQAQRQRAADILNGSARKAVTEATVVLTNPTHFAVALRYRPGIDPAPVVAARGRGEVAQAIRELAIDEGVPVLEYPQLTRAIYFGTRAGQAVSEDLYVAVATVLAFVFNIDRAMAEGAEKPNVEVPPTKRFDQHGARTS